MVISDESGKDALETQRAWRELCEQLTAEPVEGEEEESRVQRSAAMHSAEEEYQALMALQRELSSAYAAFMNASL